MVEAINREMGSGTAQAVDGRVIRVNAPEDANARVAFMGRVENLDVKPVRGLAKVIVNPRTGSVVMSEAVTIEACAIAHGALSVVINTQPQVSQPNALAGGQTVATAQSSISIDQASGALQQLKTSVNLADVVKAINALGANPQDLVSILQAMKAAGALRAELEVI